MTDSIPAPRGTSISTQPPPGWLPPQGAASSRGLSAVRRCSAPLGPIKVEGDEIRTLQDRGQPGSEGATSERHRAPRKDRGQREPVSSFFLVCQPAYNPQKVRAEHGHSFLTLHAGGQVQAGRSPQGATRALGWWRP